MKITIQYTRQAEALTHIGNRLFTETQLNEIRSIR